VKIPSFVRYFNKYVLNHLTGLIARAGIRPFCIIQHTGRKSGNKYETTIQAYLLKDGFVIALTYGPEIDWYRNVIAANGCALNYHRKHYPLKNPKPMDAEVALPLFPYPEKAILGLIGIRDFVKLDFA
jgi:deazaflavin-dependent oxidoreductase (nitroreductase family)